MSAKDDEAKLAGVLTAIALAWTFGALWFWALVGVGEDVGTAMLVTAFILWGVAFISIMAAVGL